MSEVPEKCEQLRLDAGNPYLWRVGDVAVMLRLSVNDKTDDLRVAVALSVEKDGEEQSHCKRTGLLALQSWTMIWDQGDALPEPLTEEHLSALVRKHRDEIGLRAERLLQARDPELWRQQDYSDVVPGTMMGYRRMFPANFDLIAPLDGKAYYLADYHCIELNCQCGVVILEVTALDDHGDGHQELGAATIDLLSPRLKPHGPKAATTVVRKVMQDSHMQKLIAQRYAHCRSITPDLAGLLGRIPTPVRTMKLGRNQPCSCGSGKKYKKCCLNARP